MNRLHTYIGIVLGFGMATLAAAQEPDATDYRIEAQGGVATGGNTPFWQTSNRYGIVPLDANNGYMRAGVFHQQSVGNHFHWSAGVDMVVSAPRYKNVYLQQLYASIGYRCLELSIGCQEYYQSMLDPDLSSGDMILSNNARPIPMINLRVPHYTIVPRTKGWVQFKGNFSVGRSFDTGYLQERHADNYTWVKDVLWHHKSFSLQLKDTKGDFPLEAVVGIQHLAQWGGTSTSPKVGEQPHSLKDFVRIIIGDKGGSTASLSDQVNVLGNHTIGYDFSLAYSFPAWKAKWYYQHICSDKSGTEFRNGVDGLWGLEFSFSKLHWIDKVEVEYLTTRDQSGPFHFVLFDHDSHPGRGGGGDNYYNNGEYTTGNSYFGRGVGSPLLISPEYNTDNSPVFKGTRVRDFHFAAKGNLSSNVGYCIRLTVMNDWGRPDRPYLKKKESVAMAADISYRHPKLQGWEFGGSVGMDTGDVTGGKTTGVSLFVSKRGVLKRW